MNKYIEHKNNNIYIICCYDKNQNSLVKVGYSEQMEKRLLSYYYHYPFIEIIETCYLEKGKE